MRPSLQVSLETGNSLKNPTAKRKAHASLPSVPPLQWTISADGQETSRKKAYREREPQDLCGKQTEIHLERERDRTEREMWMLD